jgi:Protein of unknown function (DUF4242)
VPLYLIERRFAEQIEITDDGVRLIEEINAEEGVSWLTSFLTADRQRSYCLYEAPSPEPIVAAARRAGIPADVVTEVERVYG